jgi:hypothetical protein
MAPPTERASQQPEEPSPEEQSPETPPDAPQEPDPGGFVNRNTKDYLATYVKYSQVGFQVLGMMAVSLLSGYGLDEWVGTQKPWFMIGFAVLGILTVMIYLIRTFK